MNHCAICEKSFILSDPQTFEFENNKSLCKQCFLIVFNSRTWGSSREKRIVIEYVKVNIPHWLKWKVWERDDFTCKFCGKRKDLSVDHIQPESFGGKLEIENLQTLCRSCNSIKNCK